jgi:catalase
VFDSCATAEDFILREKITHFDHERIPERIVHAQATGAHGFFELTASNMAMWIMSDHTIPLKASAADNGG